MAKLVRIGTFEGSLTVTFDYDRELLTRMHALRDTAFGAEKDMVARWSPNRGFWRVAEFIGPKLLDLFSDCQIKISRAAYEICSVPDAVEPMTPPGFEFKTTPTPHQIVSFNRAMQGDWRFHLGDDQGLGKTKQVIDIAGALKYHRDVQLKHCLVIVCTNSIKYNWVDQIAEHSFEDCKFLGQRTGKRGGTYIGSNKDKLWDCHELPEEFFLILNVEALRDKDIRRQLHRKTESGEIDMIAVDEIHKCKNPTSEQGKGLLSLKPMVVIPMSGTPLVGSPTDLFMPMKLMGYEKNTWSAFKMHHLGWEPDGSMFYRNMDELRARWSSVQVRRLKSEVTDLPEKTRQVEWVELGKAQRKLYNEVLGLVKAEAEEMLADKVKMPANPLAVLTRLFQAATAPELLSSTLHDSAKFDRLIEMMEEQVSEGLPLVMFATQVETLKAFQRRLEPLGWDNRMIYGGVDPRERQELVRQFQKHEFPILLGSIGAMGTGLDIKTAGSGYFIDEPWSPTDKLQAEDRLHRMGITGTVNIVTVLAKDTADEHRHGILARKERFAGALVDGKAEDMRSLLREMLFA